MRTCTECEVSKPLDREHFHVIREGYFRGVCKECVNASNRKPMNDLICETCGNLFQRKRSKTRFCSLVCNHKDAQLRRYYNMDVAQLHAMLLIQNYKCVCGTRLSWNNAVVDHDHSCCDSQVTCGKCVRGLLCQHCNSALGFVKDDVSTLLSLVEYLKVNDRLNTTTEIGGV